MTAGFADHFSAVRGYGRFRPGYPEALFDRLAAIAPARRLVWDCGCGSGLSSRGSARRFVRVIATDPSPRQLMRAAPPLAGLTYAAGRAERAPLPDHTADLVTVGQALHWFDRDAFYAEVRRVARPDAVLAVWTYDLVSVDPAIDAVVRDLAHRVVGDHWPPERRLVERRYADIAFPFERLELPPLEMSARWDLDRTMGYLGTWSAVDRYRRATGRDPLAAVRGRLASRWGEGERSVRWPLTVLAGRVR